MLVKITDFPDDLADQLKHLTVQATASKAVLRAAQLYPAAVEYFISLKAELEAERQKVKVLQQRIESARSAAALLLDHTGQEDLL